MRGKLLNTLSEGIVSLGLSMDRDAKQRLIDFLYFLQKWNHAYNLTAINSLDKMLTHHLLDSLAVADYIKGDSVLDVGSGAGFPGVPLSIYFPNKQFVLLDSNGKKIRFLFQAKSALNLKNVECEQERVENFISVKPFDVIICRAVGNIKNLMQSSGHLLASNGRWLFMKGAFPEAELKALQGFTVKKISVPGMEAERHLIIVKA
jgi:16S rRNA (guanine527-N7)-methyltransferase